MSKNKTLPEGYILYSEKGFIITGIGGGSSGIYFKTLEKLNKGLAEITEALFVSYSVNSSFQLELYNSKGGFVKTINIKLTKKMLKKRERKEEMEERMFRWF